MDPCEGIVDKPKVYDRGWNKKLNYVIAVSVFDVQDVTKRYVMDHDALKERRKLVDEAWLNKILLDTSESWQKCLDGKFKTKVVEMRLTELVELMFAKPQSDLSEEESIGRQSGSLAWRLARQETKSEASKSVSIEPCESEIKSQAIEIKYGIVKDVYERGSKIISGWSSLTKEVENLFKKEELAWKMVYLARKGKQFFFRLL